MVTKEKIIGDRVKIPNRKSVGIPIGRCGAVKRAAKIKQPFLYITKVMSISVLLNDNIGDGSKGSIFLKSEIESYKN